MATVKLQEVVDELDALMEGDIAYLNRQTGEIVTLSQEDRSLGEGDEEEDDELLPEWQLEMLPKIREVLESPDFLELPDKLEIHEWEIMNRFCHGVADDAQRTELLDAIHGRGAFRVFRSAATRFGLLDQWREFRTAALAEIARAWLDDHGIDYDE